MLRRYHRLRKIETISLSVFGGRSKAAIANGRLGFRLCENALGMFVGGVGIDPGGIVRLGAANSTELVRADA